MALAVQQSLFEAGGGTPMVESARWIEGVMLGEIALGLCVIAVTFIGALMLNGRLPLREGGQIVVGCFVLLCAPAIAAGLSGSVTGRNELSEPLQLFIPPIKSTRPNLPQTNLDQNAGASLRKD